MLDELKQIGELKKAVEACGELNVGFWPGQYDRFIQALADFMGGPVESVDAFVTGVSVYQDSGDKYCVMWIRGNSIGLLTGSGSEHDNAPPLVNGWVRPVPAVSKIEHRSATFYIDTGTNAIAEVRPTVRIHFADDVDTVVEIGVGGRTNQTARDQAAGFIQALLRAVAGLKPEQ